ncbi:unnamed protein product [Ceratitis capitata]|uniref:(Mediterranean fruit fly) hypothetical protein n=1 Tax=Ceratitis capitata TaxID=7213 RepID=A0A811V425_CERCA|nr:unnamed protein product [Ceratitis capitata]
MANIAFHEYKVYQIAGGQFTSPRREITRPGNFSRNKDIFAKTSRVLQLQTKKSVIIRYSDSFPVGVLKQVKSNPNSGPKSAPDSKFILGVMASLQLFKDSRDPKINSFAYLPGKECDRR